MEGPITMRRQREGIFSHASSIFSFLSSYVMLYLLSLIIYIYIYIYIIYISQNAEELRLPQDRRIGEDTTTIVLSYWIKKLFQEKKCCPGSQPPFFDDPGRDISVHLKIYRYVNMCKTLCRIHDHFFNRECSSTWPRTTNRSAESKWLWDQT